MHAIQTNQLNSLLVQPPIGKLQCFSPLKPGGCKTAALQLQANIQAFCGLTGRSTGQIAAGFAIHNFPVNFNVRPHSH
jgi:hypothetical protein